MINAFHHTKRNVFRCVFAMKQSVRSGIKNLTIAEILIAYYIIPQVKGG